MIEGNIQFWGFIRRRGRRIASILLLTGLSLLLGATATGMEAIADERVIPLPPGPGPLDNPLKGWCPYTNAGPISQPYSMVFLYVSWKELEPHEGEYAFEAWERLAWESPLAKGKHIVFRVYIDYPGQPTGMPDWLIAKGVKRTPYHKEGGGLSPDYNDPRMVTAMERLIAALGRRYDQNPRVAFVEMGFLGFWGEWHTYPHTELFAGLDTQQRILEAAHQAFPHKILMTRYPAGPAGKDPWIGFFDDMFPEDTDGSEEWKFLPVMRRSRRTDNWKQAAVGGEMVPHMAKRWLGEDFQHTLQNVETAHFTWIGPYGPALDSTTEPDFLTHSQALIHRMGYEFRLTDIRYTASVRRQNRLKIAISGHNLGVAPFYYPWPVELALMDAKGRIAETLPVSTDIRAWLPGPFRFAASLPVHAAPGRYALCLGIRDPWTGKPAIGFANALPRRGGWTLLSELTIAPSE
jgi:hypothetical protein